MRLLLTVFLVLFLIPQTLSPPAPVANAQPTLAEEMAREPDLNESLLIALHLRLGVNSVEMERNCEGLSGTGQNLIQAVIACGASRADNFIVGQAITQTEGLAHRLPRWVAEMDTEYLRSAIEALNTCAEYGVPPPEKLPVGETPTQISCKLPQTPGKDYATLEIIFPSGLQSLKTAAYTPRKSALPPSSLSKP